MDYSVEYKTTAHTLKGKGTLLLIMTVISTALMLISMAATGNFIIGILFFIGGVYGIKYWFSGEAVYLLTKEGISRNLRPMTVNRIKRREQNTFFKWDQIKSYKTGKDQFRSLKEFEFLEINLPFNETWEINNQKNNEAFHAFKDEFIKRVAEINSEIDSLSENNTAPEASKKTGYIYRKKSFYEKPWAMVYLWIMAIIIVGMILFFILYPEYFTWLRIFQLVFIIVPAWLYIYYRLYRQKPE